MKLRLGFDQTTLSDESTAAIRALAHQARADILTMTTLAKSGHPGG